jgi:hypothetical protein
MYLGAIVPTIGLGELGEIHSAVGCAVTPAPNRRSVVRIRISSAAR